MVQSRGEGAGPLLAAPSPHPPRVPARRGLQPSGRASLKSGVRCPARLPKGEPYGVPAPPRPSLLLAVWILLPFGASKPEGVQTAQGRGAPRGGVRNRGSPRMPASPDLSAGLPGPPPARDVSRLPLGHGRLGAAASRSFRPPERAVGTTPCFKLLPGWSRSHAQPPQQEEKPKETA